LSRITREWGRGVAENGRLAGRNGGWEGMSIGGEKMVLDNLSYWDKRF